MRLVSMAIGFSIIFLFSGAAISKNKVIYYDEQIVTLSGVTSFKVFPGPPNYESIADGDIREGAIFLTLDKTIDATASPNAPYFRRHDRENNMKMLHVANNDDKYWPLLRAGHHIKITGTLFHRLTGHHRTRVLIDVIRVEPFEMKKNEPRLSPVQLSVFQNQYLYSQITVPLNDLRTIFRKAILILVVFLDVTYGE